ncbi:alpha/beta hydrolase family protein [Bacillus methanolicus]|uniref:PGAP1 family protein n=1 Tax=Bacillus methanolicus (strain MGA3 / ATCC 53907) TaxID=796606 RepID=I3E8P1_BACMM|nr:alpha/beta fold hydrolase [Bacillus methanolicus]AIE60130.1 PGAP1 family protein [Bacillus methanolicus MGA3]EIJ82862.1 PGAP1 family protein [Bacillus methanolicus MGA3]
MGTYVKIPWKQQYLAASIDFPPTYEKSNGEIAFPLVIICHGFTSSRIGTHRLFVKTAHALTSDGFVVIRFDYEGCGESPGVYGDSGLDEFIEQTKAVIDFGTKLNNIDREQVVLLGHSLGGATALLTAVEDERVSKLILWSAVAHPYEDIRKIVGKEKVANLKKVSAIDHLGYSLTAKYFHSLEKYHPLNAARNFSKDVLLIHGTNDEEIPAKYSEDYERIFLRRETGTCIRKEVIGANHTFSCGEHFQDLISKTCEWITKNVYIPAKQI